MRRRLAFLVTCVCLICCIAFTTVYTRATFGRQIDSATEDLLRICRLSAEYLDNAAFSPSEEIDALKKLAGQIGAEITVLDADGMVIADTKVTASVNPADGEEVAAALNSESGEGIAMRKHRGNNAIFAAHRLQEGGVVVLWRTAPTLRDCMGVYGGNLLLIAILQIIICYLLVQAIVSPAEQMVLSVKSVLQAFAEGRFDERATPKTGYYKGWVDSVNEAAQRIEDQLMRENRRTQAMSAVLNQSQNGMLAVDDAMRITLITSSAKQLLNIKGNCDGLPLQEASKDVNLEPVFQEAMRHDGVYTNEVALRTGITGRSHQPLRLYASPLRRNGHTVGAVAMVEDITELRRLEEVRTDFAANVSHELKTPLTSIKGFVETLMAGAIHKPEMAEKFLKIIMLETDRLTRLINDILSITKMESGQAEVSCERIRLDKMAFEVADMLRIHAGEKNVTVSANENEEPVYVWGNPDRVEQMLINLIENGIKYNKPGGEVRVSVYGTQDNAHLLVSDTGIGIAEEHLPRMFERFYRVDKGRSRSMGGTGLGLAIVKHIVSAMGGMIEVHSKLGEGTEFLVTVPRYYSENNSEVVEEESSCR